MKELVVQHPEWNADEVSASIALGGRVLGDRAHQVSFVTSEPFGREVDFLLPLILPPAMITGSRLKLPGMVSSRLFSAVPKVQDVLCSWGSGFQRVPVDAEVRSGRSERAPGVACFFSGGVDSFYTLLKHRDEVTHLIFVHGFDIPLTHHALRAQASHAVREVARELGKTLIEVGTNLRSFSDPLVYWRQYYHGAAMASVGLLFQQLFHKVLIPGTHHYSLLVPLGSHPLLDPLWSTELTDFEHDGCEATRVDKVAYISRDETAMKWLRVCEATGVTQASAYNCGRCEKCLLTMVNLRAAGALERCRTLPSNLDLEAIANIDLSHPMGREFARQNMKALQRLGTDPDLARALAKATQPPTLYPGRPYKLTDALTERALKAPGVGKLVRRGGRATRFREVFEPAEWNAAVRALGGSVTQSWEWGLLRQREGWKPLRLLDEEGRGTVQLLLKDQPGGGSIAYAPYGPLAASPSDLPEITESAARSARECGAYLLKIEPRWGVEENQEILQTGSYVQTERDLPGSTLIVSIPKDPEDHLKALPEDTRHKMLEAHRQGVEVVTLSGRSLDIGSGVEEFLDLLEDISKPRGLSVAPWIYEGLAMNLPTHLLLARQFGRVVAAAVIATFGDEAYCLYGAFDAEKANLYAPYLVQWEAMDVARQRGCSRYDMWGMPSQPHPVYSAALRFDYSKDKFGGTPVEYGGASIRILSHLKLWEHSAIGLGAEGLSTFQSLRDKNLKGRISLLVERAKRPCAPEKAEEIRVQVPSLPVSGKGCDDLLVLVDRKTPLPESYVPQDLVPLRSYRIPTLTRDMLLRQEAAEHLAQLVAAATAAGEKLVVAAAHRSFQDQQVVFVRYNVIYGDDADKVSARPGHSQHQLGTTVDFTYEVARLKLWLPFVDTSASRWLLEHAHEYGFVLAYPEGGEAETGYRWEPWHYRYIGVENARRLKESGLSLQAFLLQEGVVPN